MTHENDWVSAHIFYHDDLDRPLVNLVGPLVAELVAHGPCRQYFFLRHWDGGPHLRLRLLADPATHDQVRAHVTERSIDFFRSWPATGSMDPSRYHDSARRLAGLEGLTDYCRTLVANNSVAFIPYRREHHRYGRGPRILAVEQHFTESSHIALELVRTGMPPEQRDTVALSLLLLTWLGENTDSTWLEPWLPASLTPPDVEERYLRQQERIHAIVARMRSVASKDAHATTSGTFAAWNRSIGRLRSALSSRGGLGSFRILDTCAHLVCNRLGVGLAGEAYLRYLATRGLADSTVRTRAPR